MDTKVEPIRGNKLLRNMKQRIEGMLSKKGAAVKVGLTGNVATRGHTQLPANTGYAN